MSAKSCVACNKLIASSLATCTFCGAEQPAEDPQSTTAKELRCKTCKRLYSSKLEACPFCAQGPALTRSGGAVPYTPRSEAQEDEDQNQLLRSALLFGVPLIGCSIWAIVKWMHSDRLGGEEKSGLIGPSVVVAVFLAPALATIFVRGLYRTLTEAIEDNGSTKIVGLIALVAAIMMIPTTLTVFAVGDWINDVAIDDRERDVQCKALTVTHRMNKGADLGWHIAYTCDVDGEHLVGTHVQPQKPPFTDGSPIHFHAARGRFGIWVRRSEPLPPNVVPIDE